MKNLSLKQRIVTHIVYRDVFNAPVSLPELCGWISSDSRDEIDRCVTDLISEGRIELHDALYCLKGRSEIIGLVPSKRKLSNELLRKNFRSLRLLRFVPFIRYVGISGSVAAYNATPDAQGPNKGKADLDVFIITAPYTLWLVYYFVRLFVNLSMRLNNGRHVLCFNYAMDSTFLEVHNKSFFTATELFNLKTIIDRQDSRRNLYVNNQWAQEYYPALKVDSSYRKSLIFILLPFVFILNISFYLLFCLSRCLKNFSLRPLRDVSFSFNPTKPTSSLRVCSSNGGYEWSIRSRFAYSFLQYFPDLYSSDLINHLFPQKNMSPIADPDMTLAFIKYQSIAVK